MDASKPRLTGAPPPTNTLFIAVAFASLAILYYVGNTIYVAFFGPLAKFPGPLSRKFSRIPSIWSMVSGVEGDDRPGLHRKYGAIVRVAPTELSFAGGQQAWQDIYGFKKTGQPKPFKDPMFYGRSLSGADSLITANDENHTRQRKILSHAFSDKAMKDQEPLLKAWAALMTEKLRGRAESGEKADMLKFYNCTTFDIMGDLAFSESLNMLNDSEYAPWVKAIFASIKIGTMFRGLMKLSWITRMLLEQILSKIPTIKKKQEEHANYSKHRVDRRLKREPEHPDLWSKILERSQGPDGLATKEHYATANLFMIAGTETTATALSGTTYHLLQNPKTMEKLTAEIREAFSNYDDIHLEDLARLRYLNAVLQEGLRMYPPVPIALPRCTPKGGAAIYGEWLPEGTVIGVHQLSTYRMEEHWHKPNEFHPERWLGDAEFKNDHLNALEPFSVGPRNCLGRNLAWLEMRLLLVAVVLNFDLKLCDESQDWMDQKIYTLWEKKPLICTLTAANART